MFYLTQYPQYIIISTCNQYLFFEMGSYSVAQTDLELTTLLPPLPGVLGLQACSIKPPCN